MNTPADSAPALTWRLRDRRPEDIQVAAAGTEVPADWIWGEATGRGVRVCVIDSGIEPDHTMIGRIDGSWAVTGEPGALRVEEAEHADACGHGTACAGVIRRVAPECELYSVRVLGEGFSGTGEMLLAGLRWAVGQRFDVINMSLSTTKVKFTEQLRALADEAFFRRCAIVASAHNTPVESFPWRFSSVISVGSHGERDPDLYLYNPTPPVEFFAKGQNVRVAWLGGRSLRTTGNSFATPYISGLCARILSKHPQLTVFQLKSLLYQSAANVRVAPGGVR